MCGAPGHGIVLYVWTFGDGESASVADDEPVTHVYQSGAPTHTFVIGLTVIDEQGLRDSAVRSVTVVND